MLVMLQVVYNARYNAGIIRQHLMRIGQKRVQDDKKDEEVAEDSAHRAASAF